MGKIAKNTWVEIEKIVFFSEERAANIPPETSKHNYVLKVNGFLSTEAALGETVTIKTLANRELSGKLITINPSYNHSFGTTMPELLSIGREADIL